MAGRHLHARHRAQVPYGVREYGCGEGAGEYGRAQARSRHDRRRVAGEVGGLVAGVVADDHEAVGLSLRLQVRGEAGGRADDDRAVHTHRARAEFAAQARRAELEGAAEACGELRCVLGVDELGEFLTGLRVGVLGQPCLGPCDEFVLHVGSTSSLGLASFRPRRPCPFPSPGAVPPDPLIGLNGLVLKRRTGWLCLDRAMEVRPGRENPALRRLRSGGSGADPLRDGTDRGGGGEKTTAGPGPGSAGHPCGWPSRAPPGGPPRG